MTQRPQDPGIPDATRPGAGGLSFVEQVALANIQAAAADTIALRTFMHQVYSWSTVAMAAIFAGGLAMMGENGAFANPKGWSDALVVFLVFGAVIPGVATMSGRIFLTEVARMLQGRLLAEAFEIEVESAAREGRPPLGLLFREHAYFQWQLRARSRGGRRGGADVTRNGYMISALIYCAAMVAGLSIAAAVLVPSRFISDNEELKPAILIWTVGLLFFSTCWLLQHALAVRDLMKFGLDLGPDGELPS